MKNNKSEVLFILDRSGSMGSFGDETRTQLNSIIKESKNTDGDGEMNFSLVMFDNDYEKVIDRKNIKEVETLSKDVNFARGSTALFDAIGRSFNELGEQLASEPEEQRPSKVVVFILTDGQENSSQEFSKSQIEEMVKRQENDYNWEVNFVSSDLSATHDAQSYSTRNMSVNSVPGSQGRTALYSKMSAYTSNLAKGNFNASFDVDQEELNKE